MSKNKISNKERPSRIRLVQIIAAGLLILILGAVIYAYCIYNGYLLLNNPSDRKYPVRGVDVAHYQGEIDWPVLAQEGITFAYIKATEGSSHVDRKFADNWDGVKQTDLIPGAYHFFSFDSPGQTQAANFIAQVEVLPGMMPPVVDVEYYGDKKNNPPEPEDVRRELRIMLDYLQSYYGTAPVIYSTEDVWELYLKGRFDDYPLWIRNVFSKPRKDADWTFWQYTNRARLKGYQGVETFIDVNVFSGRLEEWAQWRETSAVQ